MRNKREAPKQNTVKDLFFHVKGLVEKTTSKLLNARDKIPFNVRAFLKILVLWARGESDFRKKVNLESHEFRMIADFLVAGWLNAGYRNPKAFGASPCFDKEHELEFTFYRAVRITFEHVMLLQTMKDVYVEGIDVAQVNQFIRDSVYKVRVIYQKIVDVDLSDLFKMGASTELVDSCVAKIDDLELLFDYT